MWSFLCLMICFIDLFHSAVLFFFSEFRLNFLVIVWYPGRKNKAIWRKSFGSGPINPHRTSGSLLTSPARKVHRAKSGGTACSAVNYQCMICSQTNKVVLPLHDI